MNETLSVIDEHIIDMNTPRSSLLATELRGHNDSGSEYSAHIDHRLSYINGNETDEEERDAHSEAEVMGWTAAQVAQYLREIGVEARHCEIFKEQEITGEVLLGIDQASIFMKEFDLGLVGRRLRTWHKIKTFQEELQAHKRPRGNGSSFAADDTPSDTPERSESQSSTNGSMLPRIQSMAERSSPRFDSQRKQHGTPRILSQPQFMSLPQPQRIETHSLSQNSVPKPLDSPVRPSAASVRELNHSRRHSSADFTVRPSSKSNPVAGSAEDFLATRSPSSPTRSPTSPHKKNPSFDRNWTMSAAIPVSSTAALGLSSLTIGGHALALGTDRNTFDPNLQELGLSPIPSRPDTDRGYMSGGEAESKRFRNVLRKRDIVSASHSRQSSYKEENGNSLTVAKRHSRFGSADSIRDTLASVASPAARMYHGSSFKGRFRSASTKESISESSPTEVSSPIVTKLDYPPSSDTSVTGASPRLEIESPPIKQDSFLRSMHWTPNSSKSTMGARTVSDTVTGSEKTMVTSPTSIPSPMRESPMRSPTRTGSTTTSGASKSFDMESTDTSSKGTSNATVGIIPPTPVTKRSKNKKKTSAYTRGLMKISPQELTIDCDYSGWMKKKSPSLMSTWKPRLFVLRGRRLSYYYSDDDTEEKGLIDISSHRVLPADQDRITGLHATVTGAKSSPMSPPNSHTPTLNSTEAATDTGLNTSKPGSDTMFIFKLVPPRTGLSRAVNFTKPTVHYFAVENVKQGRLWMAALMKATIERDTTFYQSTYTQKTISLAKAKAMRQRPPALMGADEKADDGIDAPTKESDANGDGAGLNIQGLEMNDGEKTSDAAGRSSHDDVADVVNDPRSSGADEPVLAAAVIEQQQAPNSLDVG